MDYSDLLHDVMYFDVHDRLRRGTSKRNLVLQLHY